MDRKLALALLTSWGFAAHAGSGGEELSIHTRSLAAASALAVASPVGKAMEAPFVGARGQDPLPALMLREELDRRGPHGSCEASASDLCYDLKEGRIVYKAARRYMPEVSGLRAESISLRHDRIVLKYSFR